jgi:hypothetical protein
MSPKAMADRSGMTIIINKKPMRFLFQFNPVASNYPLHIQIIVVIDF